MRWFSLATAAAFSLAGQAAAQVFSPIPVTGYTSDVIADAAGAAQPPWVTTNCAFDSFSLSGLGVYVLYQQGYNTAFPTRGVPTDGSIVTSPTRSYQLGPISANNALHLFNGGSGPSTATGTLSLVTPARYAALSLLLADGNGRQPSEGGTPGSLAVNWSNGSATTYQYTVYDWFLLSGTPGPNSGVAIGGLDRVNRSDGTFENSLTDPRLFYYDIDLSADPNYLAGALINSVTATRFNPTVASAEATNIMGLSGATVVPEPSALMLLGAAAGLAARRVGQRLFPRDHPRP